MSDDEDFAEIERLSNLDRQVTYWNGRAEGGPIDGSAINVEAVAFLPMRGLQVAICVGEDVDSAAWHSYAFGQRMVEGGGIVGFFQHLGAIEGDPKRP